MAKITIEGRTYNLVMSIRAMEHIEKEYGDLKEAMTKFRGRGKNMAMIKTMFRILANAGQHAAKLPEDVTGDEIDDLSLKGLETLSNTLRKAMDEGMDAETVGGGPADDEEHDVYAEQLERQEKNGLTGEGSGSGNTTDTP